MNTQPMPIILYHTSLDCEINRMLSQRPITSRPQPMFSCHCKHLLAPTHQRDAAFQAAMDRNNN